MYSGIFMISLDLYIESQPGCKENPRVMFSFLEYFIYIIFFSAHYPVKVQINKKLTELYSEPQYIHHLVSTINIFYTCFYHIYPYPHISKKHIFDAFQVKLKTETPGLNASACMSLTSVHYFIYIKFTCN